MTCSRFRVPLFVFLAVAASFFGLRRVAFAAEACVAPNEKLVSASCESKGWIDTKLGCGIAGEPVEKGGACVCCQIPAPTTGGTTGGVAVGDATDALSCASAGGYCLSNTVQTSCPTGETKAGTCGAPLCCIKAAGAAAPPISNYCFTQDECTSPEYGGSLDRYVAGQGCPANFGKCLAPEPILTLSSPVLGQASVQGFRSYVLLMFNFLLNIIVVVAAIMFVYGGFRYILGSSFGDIKAAKERMVNATIGLVLTFASVILLQTVNPATLKLDAVKVWLIKRIEVSLINQCNLFKPANGKEVKFADAGSPPGAIPFSSDPNSFTIAGADTQCGRKYYIQGTNGQTCSGSICPDQTTICNVCAGLTKGAAPECGPGTGKTETDMACLKAQFAGHIAWQSYTTPFYVVGVPVCGYAQPADVTKWDLAGVTNNVLSDFAYAKIYATGQGNGITPYALSLSDSQVSQWETECNDGKGGLRGIVLGVVYNDNCSLLEAGGKLLETAAGGTSNSGLGTAVDKISDTVGGIYNAISCKTSDPDITILTKQDCENSTVKNPNAPYFSGYRTVSDHGIGFTNAFNTFQSNAVSFQKQLAAAIYTGWRINPKQGVPQSGITHRFDKLTDNTPNDPYWGPAELRAGIKFEKAIQCNFTLNQTTAPRDPSDALMSSFLIHNDVEPSGAGWVTTPLSNPIF